MTNEGTEPRPRFRFYEVVKVRSTPGTREQNIAAKKGAVLGITEPEHIGEPIGYAITLYELDETWSVEEEDLEATGEMDTRDTFYGGESIRVSREGEILDD